MKKWLIILLFFACNSPDQPTSGVTEKLGFAFGQLTYNNLVNQTVVVPAGIYSKMTISNPVNSVIDASQATFTGPVYVINSKRLTLKGGTSKNVSGDAIIWQGNHNRPVERGWKFTGVSGNCNIFPDKTPYKGDTSSLSLYMGVFDSLSVYRSGELFQGAWGEAKDTVLFMDSVVFSNIKIDSTLTPGTQVRGVIFRLGAYNWNVVYKGSNTALGDVGVFYVYGNGNIRDNFKTGGRGYWGRIWHCGLKGPANTYFHNNIDLSTSTYGTLDIRSEKGQFNRYVRPAGSAFLFNNTSGNKYDNIQYGSQLAVIGSCDSGFRVDVNKNLGFNLRTGIIKDQSNGTWKGDSTGNLYYVSGVGIVDTLTGIQYNYNGVGASKPGPGPTPPPVVIVSISIWNGVATVKYSDSTAGTLIIKNDIIIK